LLPVHENICIYLLHYITKARTKKKVLGAGTRLAEFYNPGALKTRLSYPIVGVRLPPL